MRITPAELAEMYCCPRCKYPLASLQCSSCGVGFESVHGIPVLVDFKDSVLERSATIDTAAESPVPERVAGRSPRLHAQVASNLDQLSRLLKPGSRVLVVGGGEDAHGLGNLISQLEVSSVTFDIYSSTLTDFVADAHSIPLLDQSVDCVAIQAVLEHVLEPWRVVEEIYRVLRPGGVVYAETPFMQQVHEGPYDFMRFTESGHRWLFRKFELIDSGAIGGPIMVLAWTMDFLLRGLRAPSKLRGALRRILTRLSRFDVALNRHFNADSASAVYFTGRKPLNETQLSPSDIIAFYSRNRS